jgi:hypothetical protein
MTQMPDSPLKTTVHTQMIAAMKSGDKSRTQVLRMLLSEIKRKEADDVNANAQEAVNAYAKTLKKAMADMEKHGDAAAAGGERCGSRHWRRDEGCGRDRRFRRCG